MLNIKVELNVKFLKPSSQVQVLNCIGLWNSGDAFRMELWNSGGGRFWKNGCACYLEILPNGLGSLSIECSPTSPIQRLKKSWPYNFFVCVNSQICFSEEVFLSWANIERSHSFFASFPQSPAIKLIENLSQATHLPSCPRARHLILCGCHLWSFCSREFMYLHLFASACSVCLLKSDQALVWRSYHLPCLALGHLKI